MTGPPSTWARDLAGGLDDLNRLLDECRRFAREHGVPDATERDVVVALEEVVTNVLRHGAVAGREPAVRVAIDVGDGALTVTVTDDGPAFNPLAVPPPPRDLPLAARPVGGLGIVLYRRLMDELDYAREAGRNRLELRKRFTPVR